MTVIVPLCVKEALAKFVVEWDEATTPGITTPGYAVQGGYASVPSAPGFGLELDEDAFGRAVRDSGFCVTA